jgi:AraC-like DNA-binding protein
VDDKKYIHGQREPRQNALTVLRVQKLHFEPSFVFRTNFIENDVLFLISSGGILYKNKTVESGNIIYFPEFSAFHFLAEMPTEILEIRFDYSAKLPFSAEKPYIVKAPLDTQELFNQIYRKHSAYDNLPGVKEGLLLNILNTLNTLYRSYSAELILYQKCYEWIEQNAAGPLTAESTAKAMECSVAHLNRTVKKYSNKCLSELIAEKRLSKIKQFVKYSNNTTQEIAATLGFETAELLRKFFKYHTGISLREYKKTSI